MTNQEAFTTVVNHLRKQGCKAMVETGCRYRTPNGQKCAIGILMPDELYQPTMESTMVGYLLTQYTLVREHLDHVDLALLEALQSVHDFDDVECWEQALQHIADTWNLVMPTKLNV